MPKLTKWECLLIVGVATYTMFFSIYLSQKYEYFRTGYFDFGQSVQTVWLASQGRFNALALGRPISIIAALPFLLYPHPETLLALQSFAIAMGAVPVFYLSQKELENPHYALILSVLYLCYAPVWGVNLYEYHDLAFSITFLLFSALYYSKKKLVGFSVSLGLALISNPYVVIIGAAIALSMVLDYGLSTKPRSREVLRFLVAGAATTLTFALYLEAIPYLPHFEMSSLSTGIYTFSGSAAYININSALANPWFSISFEWPNKAAYILEIFGSLLFLPLLGIRKMIPALPWLGLVAVDTPQVTPSIARLYILTQWSTFLIPFLVVSSIFGFKRLSNPTFPLRKWLSPRRAMGFMVLSVALVSAIAGGLSPISAPQIFSVGDTTVPTDSSANSWWHGVLPTPVQNLATLDRFVMQVPFNDSVLTQNQIGSKLGERFQNVWTYYQPGYGEVNADAILVDYNLPGLCTECLNKTLSTGDYNLFLSDNNAGIYLYFRVKPSP